MKDIVCPHCAKAFKVDEAGYASILQQVRDQAFDEALHERLVLAEEEKRNAVELALSRTTNEFQKSAATKDSDASQESPEWGHGALTKAFLDTIEDTQSDSNRDSLLQVAELDTGLTERVKQLTQGGQTMQLAEFGDAIRNTALLKFKTRATKAIE